MAEQRWGVHYFKHPVSGEVIKMTTGFSWLWVLLFGCFWFGFKGMWGHAVLALGLAIVTSGLAWLLYPFFTYRIVKRHCRMSGWLEVDGNGEPLAG